MSITSEAGSSAHRERYGSWARPTQVVLVRHAQAELMGSQVDRVLTETGTRQASQVAERLAGELLGAPVTLLTSRYRRCEDTAAPIALALGVEATVDDRLSERFSGDADALTIEETIARYPGVAGPWGWEAIPGSERWRAVHDRSADLLRSLDRESVWVLVTHGSNIHLLCAAWLGLAHEQFLDIAFDSHHASITVLRRALFGAGAIDRLADTAHLIDTGPRSLAGRFVSNPKSIQAWESLTPPTR